MDVRELLERVTKAEGPDREIDCAIAVTVGGFYLADPRYEGEEPRYGYIHPEHGHIEPGQGGDMLVPRYTAKVDAALALVERVLPTAIIDLHQNIGGHQWQATLTDGAYCIAEGGSTLPLAILAALLQALAERTRDA